MLTTLQDFDDDTRVADVIESGLAALARDQVEFVRRVGVIDRRSETLGDPPAHVGREGLGCSEEEASRIRSRSWGSPPGLPSPVSRVASDDVRAHLSQVVQQVTGFQQAIDGLYAQQPEPGVERVRLVPAWRVAKPDRSADVSQPKASLSCSLSRKPRRSHSSNRVRRMVRGNPVEPLVR